MARLGERLAGGDRSAFADLYDLCAHRVHHYLVARLGSRDDADDVLQETFVRLARAPAKLAQVENLSAYVFTVARNEAARLMAARVRERREMVVAAEDLFLVPANDRAASEAAEQVTEALADLNADEREMIELKVFGGLVLREIAEVTGVPQGTVATRYRTALARLRSHLARKCHE
jgi:RNA polymerase sigma-70 factor, ECF subfamily